MKQLLYSAALLLATCAATAKTGDELLKANYLYTHLAYHEAIGYYEKVAPAVNDPVTLSRLGDCYRLTKDPQQANTWYAKAVLMNGCPEDTRLHYGQTLMETGDNARALDMLKQYLATNPGDRRAANMVASCEKIVWMKQQIPVGSIQFMSLNSDRSEFGPALRRNELFFTSDSAGKGSNKKDQWTGEPYYNIYSSNCSPSGSCGMQRELLGKTNVKYHDGPCTFSPDGGSMYLTRTSYEKKLIGNEPNADKNDIVHLEIVIATDYDEASGKYKKVSPFKYNNRDYSVAHPAVSRDGNTMLFVSDMKGGQGGTDIYMCRRGADGNWGAPENAGPNINTEGDELFPTIDADNNVYFSSNGLVGYGGLDIYKSSWNTATNAFAPPVNMGMPLNSTYDDMSLVYTDDGVTAFFASNRPAKARGDNIYSFNPQSLFLSVTAVDTFTNQPIPGFTLKLTSPNDATELSGGANGKVVTRLYPKVPYTALASAFGYKPREVDITTPDTKKTSDTVYAIIKLRSNAAINLELMVYDQASHQPLDNPTVVFRKTGQLSADTAHPATGTAYTATLDAGSTYQVFAMKDNYYGNEKMISTKGITPRTGSVKVRDTLFMKKLQIGEVYRIDDIYYDYDKANVREDAKLSLDRLISLLNQYPNMKIQVNSHTDCRGADKYNLRLSDQRAHSVITYLQQRGINLSRLKYKGYGETSPVYKCPNCDKCTEAEHQANRRTEFMIIAM